MTDNNTPAVQEKYDSAGPVARFHPQWRYAATLNVRQAAYLWGGYEPRTGILSDLGVGPDGKIRVIGEPASFAANFQMLKAAIHTGKLTLLHKVYTHYSHEDDQVSRDSLIEFATEIGQFPEFLFDTVLAETENDVPDSADLSDEPSFADKGGGRPRLYHWNKIAGLVAFLEGEVGLFKMTDPQIVELIRDKIRENPAAFCEKGHIKAPDASSVERKIGKMIDALRELRAENNAQKDK